MTTTEQAFIKFQIKINETYESSKIGIDRGRFVILYNEAQNKMVEFILNRKNTDDYTYIQNILVPNKKLPRLTTTNDADVFEMPEDLLNFSSAYSTATMGNCKDVKINLFDIKDDNKTEVLQDEFNGPSFLAREAPISMANNKFYLYKDSFTHENLFLSYYRYPKQIQLLDPDNPESQFDPNINPEFDDLLLDRILSMAASEFEINTEGQKFQIDRMRATEQL
jgi:hypothetical protein